MAAGKKTKTVGADKNHAKLVLLDSHAILHRAYHALPDFTSSKGEPTGALYGLILMLLKINEVLKPDYLIAARDMPGKTHRHETFEAYKANRIAADDELKAQLGRAPSVFEAFGIPVYGVAGYEADDVLGTIVRELSDDRDIDIIIATGDMDTLQLVDGTHVRVFTLRKGLSDTVMYDDAAVRDRYGFGPERIIDYKALRGDPSDNIPGVPGIGEKTATELIQAFGSIEDIYAALAKDPAAVEKQGMKARTAKLLVEHERSARFSKELATIHAEVPIEFEAPERPWRIEEHAETIRTALDELEFRAIRERLRPIFELSAPIPEAVAESDADPDELAETALALWLLRSDLTAPTESDIKIYAQADDFATARKRIFEELRKTGKLGAVYDEIERPLMPVIERMYQTGIRVDVPYLEGLAAEYGKELAAIAARIYKECGHEFNINSPKQLAVVLFDELQIAAAKKRTATGARTTREDELAKIAGDHPVVADVLAYRELQKLLGTYIEKIPKLVAKDGRLHAHFLQAGTTTGRMSSQDPNLQNIPIRTEYGRRIRQGFAAEDGWILAAIDYSQIELRIAAGLSGDQKLVQIFQSGEDVHAATASQVFGVPKEKVDREMRRRAKIINFGILYGMGVVALRQNLGAGVSREEASAFLDQYFKNFSGLAQWIETTKAAAAERSYTETLFGRRRYFPGFKSALPNLRAQAERMAVNAPIQGTQADIIKKAMVQADELIEKNGWRDRARLLLQVHDELVYEVRRDNAEEIASTIRTVMETVVDPAQLSGVPIRAEVSIGETWGTVKRI